MILVYSHKISNRLTYTLDVVFKYILGVPYYLTLNKEEFKKSELVKINYSDSKDLEGLNICPSKLLFEKNIKEQSIKVVHENEVPCFFKTSGSEYDIFAMIFYMVSRYEEYLPFEKDAHGRFTGEKSLAFQNNFLKKPVVNIWVENLKKELLKMYPFVVFPKRTTSYINTLDIDVAYASKGKGWFKFFGGFLMDFFKKEQEKNKLRVAYLKTKKDVFDTYDFITTNASNIKTVYFFLLAKSKLPFDTCVSYKKKCFKNLLQNLAETYEIGIHPSYTSNQNTNLVTKEINRLEKIIDKKIAISRQHYLKLSFPSTYETLMKNGITVDYTMGFSDQLGFRAGICNAYPFYNLKEEAQKQFWIVPFQVMDGTLQQYLKLSPEDAIKEIQQLIKEVQKVNGLFVSLWHNSSLSESFGWQGWQKVYKEMLNLMKA